MPEPQGSPETLAAPPVEVDAAFDIAAAACRVAGRDLMADEAEAKIKTQLRWAFAAGVAFARRSA